jgi:hypothetical protein
MTRRPQHWVIGGFILLAVFVTALVVVSLLLSGGFGLPATFQVLPGEVTLHPKEGWQFRAVSDDRLMPGVKWTATGGVIGSEGFYTAPDIPGDYQIIAQHPSSDYRAAATVHVVAVGGVTAEPSPSPTEAAAIIQPTAAPTVAAVALTSASPTSAPIPTQTPAPMPATFLDGAGDLVNFDTLEPVAIAPPGTDIRAACFDDGRRLVRAVPEGLAGEIGDWDTEKNVILWIMFHEPIPTAADMERFWLFALDTDGSVTTGRPVDEGKINPDIGAEVTVGVHSNPAAGIELIPYVLVWNARLITSEPQAVDIEARLNAARDVLFIRISAEQLAAAIRTLSGVEPNWDQTVGRALATATTGEGLVADFAPERPQ